MAWRWLETGRKWCAPKTPMVWRQMANRRQPAMMVLKDARSARGTVTGASAGHAARATAAKSARIVHCANSSSHWRVSHQRLLRSRSALLRRSLRRLRQSVVVELALGVVVRPIAPSTLAICPPLVIGDDELDEVPAALRSALAR